MHWNSEEYRNQNELKYWVNKYGGQPYYRERGEEYRGEPFMEVPTPRPPRTPQGEDFYWFNDTGEWILAGFIDKDGNYHQGEICFGDQVVPRRPTHLHIWNGSEWLFDNDKALAEIRQKRDQLLKESDFIEYEDTPIDPAIKEEWLTYRQTLRDFPVTCDPENPIWPEKPEYVKA